MPLQPRRGLKGWILMPIYYNEQTKTFRLDAGKASYAFCVGPCDTLIHLYFGPRIPDGDLSGLEFSLGLSSFSPNPPGMAGSRFTLDAALQEYPANGAGDYRLSALAIRGENGSSATCLRYRSHEIRDGKYALEGMPAVYAGEAAAQTLDVLLEDPLTGAEVHLLYGIIEGFDAITRAAVIRNAGSAPFVIEKAASAALDFPRMDFDLVHLYGQWAQERQLSRAPLTHDIRTIASKRGSSSHNHNPFAALAGKYTSETHGEAYGMSLIYSGSFAIETECDAYDAARAVLGINPIDFGWTLAPGERFSTPEAVLVYSGEGLGGMSRTFHKLYRRHLCRGEWKEKIRPILVNNWEATYFNFNEEKLLAIAKDAAELGIEMLVMDDGWFGKRNDDKSSLGDWFVNEEKLKGGLKPLVDKINALGLQFGIWFEPEMISPDSDLFRAHPDWVLCAPGREPSIARNQYVLDMTRKEVRDYLFETISGVLHSANIAYVKWDFNRNLTEAASPALPPERRKETGHRYVLGLYELLERLTSAFPQVLFEGCSGGGGRFDPAMLYYSPQIWTSDDSDAIERCRIQYGTSFVYPPSSISAHVSAVPNHQTGRVTDFSTRGNVAMAGAFGYELDLTKLTAEEKELVKQQVAQYHAYAPLVQDGDFYRLISPFEDENRCAWMSVSPDRSEALVTFVVPKTKVNFTSYLRLAGLDPDRFYEDSLTGAVRSGSLLMNAGLNLSRTWRDGESVLIHLKAVR